MIKTKQFREIDVARNESLEDLFWISGEAIGFDGMDYNEKDGFDSEVPFVLAIPEKIVPGYHPSDKNSILLSHFHESEIKKYTLIPRGDILFLKKPNRYIGSLSESFSPDFRVYSKPKKGEVNYPFERAYSGKEALRNAFNSIPEGFHFYAKCLEDGRLIVERTKIERFFKSIGFGKFLKNQLRFQGKY